MRCVVLIAASMALGFCAAEAQQSNQASPGWVADKSGCHVWKPHPLPNETITWSGRCVNGRAEGKGTAQWFQDGKPISRSEGLFRAGRLNGQGTESFENGNRYEGDYRDGSAHGRGVFTWKNGDRYEGEWKDGKRSGRGVIAYADGGTYDGEWSDDTPNGRGVRVWGGSGQERGDRAEGEFRNGFISHGTIVFGRDGVRYEGDFAVGADGKHAMKNGFGNQFWPDGRRYTGMWLESRANGPGTFRATDGRIYTGWWSDGCIHIGSGGAAVGKEVWECR